MDRIVAFIVLSALGLAVASAADAKLYRWVDGDGGVHFTSKIEQVPAAQRSHAIAEAEGRPALIRSDAAPKAAPRAPDAREADTRARPGKAAGRDRWETLGEDRRRKREAVQREIEEIEARLNELEEQGAATRPPSNKWGKVSRHRIERYRARHGEWKRTKRALAAARRRLDNLP